LPRLRFTSLPEMHNLRLNFHKMCSIHEAFRRYSSVLLFLLTEEQSSREERRQRPARDSATRFREGNEEALAADVTTEEGRKRGLARESRIIPEQHCCNLFAETGLRKSDSEGRNSKENPPFCFGSSLRDVLIVRLIPSLLPLREDCLFTREKLGQDRIGKMDGVAYLLL